MKPLPPYLKYTIYGAAHGVTWLSLLAAMRMSVSAAVPTALIVGITTVSLCAWADRQERAEEKAAEKANRYNKKV